MLKLRLKNNKHSAVWLVEPKVSIGRDSGNDLVVEDASVAAQHAEILVKHEKLTLVNTSGETVLVNNKPVAERSALKVNDQLQIGRVALEVIDPKQAHRPASSSTDSTGWALKANHAALANRVFPIKLETVIGRSNDCDITLAAAHLSRRHVKLFVEDGLLYARDLGSANGTFLNGERITEARVRRGDELRFDTLRFGVIGPASEDLDKTSVRPIAAVGPKAEARESLAKGAVTGTRRPAAARVQRSGASARAGGESAPRQFGQFQEVPVSGGSKRLWAVGLLLAVALAAGLAWQQGLFNA
jgi:pSer/pThr/pTyr-binding forkhead associated (FHA) protein